MPGTRLPGGTLSDVWLIQPGEIDQWRDWAAALLDRADETDVHTPAGEGGGDDGLLSWLSALPQVDRPPALAALRGFAEHLVSLSAPADVSEVMRKYMDTMHPWIVTAQCWTENPDAERLTDECAGDGPVLGPPPGWRPRSRSETSQWEVRAAAEHVAGKWRIAVAKLPQAAEILYETLAAGKLEPTPQCQPLRGRLGTVTVGRRRLARCEVRSTTLIKRGKGTKDDRHPYVTAFKGELRITCAADPRAATVWVTSTSLFKVDRRPGSRKVAYWPDREGRSVPKAFLEHPPRREPPRAGAGAIGPTLRPSNEHASAAPRQ